MINGFCDNVRAVKTGRPNLTGNTKVRGRNEHNTKVKNLRRGSASNFPSLLNQGDQMPSEVTPPNIADKALNNWRHGRPSFSFVFLLYKEYCDCVRQSM